MIYDGNSHNRNVSLQTASRYGSDNRWLKSNSPAFRISLQRISCFSGNCASKYRARDIVEDVVSAAAKIIVLF